MLEAFPGYAGRIILNEDMRYLLQKKDPKNSWVCRRRWLAHNTPTCSRGFYYDAMEEDDDMEEDDPRPPAVGDVEFHSANVAQLLWSPFFKKTNTVHLKSSL